MLKNSLKLIQKISLSCSLFSVKKFLNYPQAEQKSFYSLSNNKMFKHACATPLTIMLCNLEEAVTNEKGSSQKQKLKYALSATKRLSEIITSVTTSDSQPESFFVAKAINELTQIFNSEHKNNVILSTTNIKGSLKLKGSKLYFQEALVCLLKNSLEAYTGNRAKPVTLIARVCGNQLKVDLVDYACGMSLFTQKLVLYEGVSYKENGTGLGLFFTKRTIEGIFRGNFLMTSQVGLGTRICISIPINQKPYSQSLLQS